MGNKTQYWSIEPILKLKADYNIVFGERSNGKTYGINQHMLLCWLKDHNNKCVYIRRYDDELTPSKIRTLFDPFDIEKMSKGIYNRIQYRSRTFIIGKYDWDNGEWETQPEIFCYVASLNTWENSKGADRGFIKNIFFDEFITRRPYLMNEYIAFQNCISSFIRDRGDCTIFLGGNSVSFYCPYFEEFSIPNIKNMQQGDLVCYSYENGLKIAVEYCSSVGETKKSAKFFNFNDKAKMITTGMWEIPEYPHYPHSINFKKDVRLRFYILFEEEQLCCCVVKRDKDLFLYVHKYPKDIPENAIIFSKEFSGSPLKCRTFAEGMLECHNVIRNILRSRKIYFANNTVGEIFTHFHQWQSQISGFSIN